MTFSYPLNQEKKSKSNTHPKAGPKNGLITYHALGRALFAAVKQSAMLPAPIANAGLYAIPAKKRRIARLAIFWEKPQPRVKIQPRGTESR